MNVICINCRQTKHLKYCCSYSASYIFHGETFDYQKLPHRVQIDVDKWAEYFKRALEEQHAVI